MSRKEWLLSFCRRSYPTKVDQDPENTAALLDEIDMAICDFTANAPISDDITMGAVRRLAQDSA